MRNKRPLTLTLLSIFFLSTYVFAQHPCAVHKQQQHQVKQAILGKRNADEEQMKKMERYDVKFHQFNLSVERSSKAISGNVRTKAVVREPMDTFVFQLYRSMNIDSIVGYKRFLFVRDSDVVYTFLDSTFQIGDLIDITIYYRGTPPAAQSAAIGAGFSNAASPTYGNRITWSLSQPYSAYEWWPCKQSLQDKIDSVYVNITTDTSNKAGSNGVLTQIVNVGNGKHRYEWQSKYPISYYLISVAVGQYTEYTYYAKPTAMAGDSIPVIHYLYNNPLAFTNNKTSIEATVPMLEHFSDVFGLYPFHEEKYGHSMAPFSGGMEHQTMTTQGVFPYDIVSHELGHQWWGDQVTCSNWSDIWLNEGFATYSEYIAVQQFKPGEAFASWTAVQNDARNTANSVWVDDTTNVSRIFNSNSTYQKGATIVHILRHLFGNDSLFFAMLRSYQQTYKMSNASAVQFKAIAEQFYGASLDTYFNEWYYGKGYPVYSLRWDQENNQVKLIFSQTNGIPTATTFFTTKVPLLLRTTGLDTTIYVYPQQASDTFTFAVGKALTAIEIDPMNWILKQVGSVVKDGTLLSLPKVQTTQTGFLLSPNPVSDRVHIILETAYPKVNVMVFDMLGKVVFESDMRNEELETGIETDTWKRGVYLVKITTADETFSSKLIKE